MPLALLRSIQEAESQLTKQLMCSGIVKVLDFTCRLLALHYPTALQERRSLVGVHTKGVPPCPTTRLGISPESSPAG